MSYKLKPGIESFEVVDGPFAGKKFLQGRIYEDVPPNEKTKFEKVTKKVRGETKKAQAPDLKPDATDSQGGDK